MKLLILYKSLIRVCIIKSIKKKYNEIYVYPINNINKKHVNFNKHVYTFYFITQ